MLRLPFKYPAQSIEFRHASRTLLHSLLVGIVVGVVSLLFYVALERTQYLLLERATGYVPLRPAGEEPLGAIGSIATTYRPWLLLFLPALGGLLTGIIGRFWAPEVIGGGGDAFIRAFHRDAGVIRRRVVPAKLLASVFTLGSGGSGGREGPTMHIGAAVGALVGRVLRLSARDRRLLLVAGTAGGMAAIFRTPLGAALLAVEALYRADFESDALVPAIVASVTSYSIFITVFPNAGHLFAHAPRYPFDPRELPLYALMALALSLAARGFVRGLEGVHRRFGELPVPVWTRPAIGGLAVALLALAWIAGINPHISMAGHGIGILGGGYGSAQGAITGATWIPGGWTGVELLVALALVKMAATSFTIGSGGSAGDFGPSLVIGGLLGGAFGRAAQLLVNPSIDPGAYALVGMGAFYGGLAHAPISSLVMVCEMAGTYDLLVPLMLAGGVTFLLLRRSGLYAAQVRSRFDSPAHRDDLTFDVLRVMRAGDVVTRGRPYVTLSPKTSARDLLTAVAGASAWQDVFPVVDPAGALVGIVPVDAARSVLADDSLVSVAIAADVMLPPETISADEDLHVAVERLLASGMREIPVVGAGGEILGLLDEADITRAYHDAVVSRRADRTTGDALPIAPAAR